MSPTVITSLTFVAAALFAFSAAIYVHDRFLRYRLEVRQRLQEMYRYAGFESSSIFKDEEWSSPGESGTNTSWFKWFGELNQQAGTERSASSVAARYLGGGLGAALLGSFGSWLLGVVFGLIGFALPLIALLMRRHTRRRRLSRQLPEAFQMVSRAVRAGQTVPAAMQIVAQNFEAPISEEFARCCEQQNLGMSRESALKSLASRCGIMELQIFVVALLVQSKSGGDLVELLDNLAAMIRKRIKLGERVRALTGEGRMQALVLTVLPIVSFVGVLLLSPEYAACLLERPWILVGTLAAQLVGTLWIRQIVNFEY